MVWRTRRIIDILDFIKSKASSCSQLELKGGANNMECPNCGNRVTVLLDAVYGELILPCDCGWGSDVLDVIDYNKGE